MGIIAGAQPPKEPNDNFTYAAITAFGLAIVIALALLLTGCQPKQYPQRQYLKVSNSTPFVKRQPAKASLNTVEITPERQLDYQLINQVLMLVIVILKAVYF